MTLQKEVAQTSIKGERAGSGMGWPKSQATRAGQYHTHLFDLALLTGQLLAYNQKGQVGVLEKGQEEERGLYTVVLKRGKGRRPGGMSLRAARLGARPGQEAHSCGGGHGINLLV